jgi:hypothetical protein
MSQNSDPLPYESIYVYKSSSVFNNLTQFYTLKIRECLLFSCSSMDTTGIAKSPGATGSSMSVKSTLSSSTHSAYSEFSSHGSVFISLKYLNF